MVDLVEMKAVLWRDETLGAEFDVVDIPDDLLETGEGISRADDRSGFANSTTRCSRSSSTAKPLTIEEIKAGIRKATIALKIFPVICGSAFKNKGVQTMLDAVVDYLPSPLDIPPVEGLDVDHPERQVDPQLLRRASRLRRWSSRS